MKQEILKSLFSTKEIERVAKKYCNNSDMYGDLVSELYLALEKKEDEFFDRVKGRDLFLYCCGILYYSWNSPRVI